MRYHLIIIITLIFIFPRLALANGLPDRDSDGVPDKDELEVYFTDPDNPDTDGDGYNDWVELNNGYSPYSGGSAKLDNTDSDGDGLSDKLELAFRTSPLNADTDGDGYKDGGEVSKGYDPGKGGVAELERKILIDKKNQLLSYTLGGVRLGIFPVSTGQPGLETFSGNFQVLEKHPRRWSRSAKLWMPYWLMFNYQGQGIHELPEWNDGTKEGENHLGVPVSHGCVRLGIGPAEELYNFAELGTKVYVN